MRSSAAALLAIAIPSLSSLSHANVGIKQHLVLDDSKASVVGGSYTVEGQLTVAYTDNAFSPSTFILNGDGFDQSLPTPTPLAEAYNGHAFFNGGLYEIGTLSVASTTSALFVNTPVTVTGTVTNSGVLTVDQNATLTAGGFSNTGIMAVNAGSALTTLGSFTSGNDTPFAALIEGAGSITATEADFGNTQLLPGDPGSAGAMTVTSLLPVVLTETALLIDVYPGTSLTHDVLAFTGALTAGGFISADFSNFTAAELDAHGPFTVVTAAAVAGAFTLFDDTAYDVNENGSKVGRMELMQNATSVYFQYVAVPEPTGVSAVALAAAGALRRRVRRC